MARYTGPRTKVSRRARQLLDENKAKYFDRRPYPPGDHGRGRVRESQYQIQLREKQKLRHMYGLLEKQFRRYYKEANRQSGITGTNLLQTVTSIVAALDLTGARTEAAEPPGMHPTRSARLLVVSSRGLLRRSTPCPPAPT